MDENQTKQNNLLDTTDCLEAVGVFRGWKNFFFVIALLCLIVLQASFWLVDLGYVTPCDKAVYNKTVAPCGKAKDRKKLIASNQTEEIKEVAEKVAAEPTRSELAEPNKPAEESQQKTGLPFDITFRHLYWTIRIVNGLLILTAVLYCLCMLFCLKLSLIGRLGGINHISRALFLSLILAILLLPWQIVFDGIIPGVIYTPCELVKRCVAETSGIFANALHYLRFTGYWLLAVLLLILSQLRSSKWTKATLRRLEVI
jgi:hypothetical protein